MNRSIISTPNVDKKSLLEHSVSQLTSNFNHLLVVQLRCKTGKRNFVCSKCGKSYKHSQGLKRHVKTHTTKKDAHTCIVCGKTFSQKCSLTIHMLSHSERLHRCFLCGKQFTLKHHLNRHYKVHTDENIFSCLNCEKSFSSRQALSGHLRTHKDVKTHKGSFLCKVCKRSFTRNSNLLHHMKTHRGEKTHSCSICCKSFVTRNALKVHLRSHTKEKAFKCSACGMLFTQSGNLTRHANKTCKGGSTDVKSNFSVQVDIDIKQDDENCVQNSPWNEQSDNHTKCSNTHKSQADGVVSSVPQSLQRNVIEQESEFNTGELSGNVSKASNLHSLNTPFVINIKNEEDNFW